MTDFNLIDEEKKESLFLTPDEHRELKRILLRIREIKADTGYGRIYVVIQDKKINSIELMKTEK